MSCQNTPAVPGLWTISKIPGLKTSPKTYRNTFSRILYEAKDLQLAVESVLKLLCRHFGVSRGYIFENTADDQGCSNTFEWCDAGVEPQIDRLQNISYASLGGYEKNFARDDIYIVHSLDDVAEEERVVLEPQGIRSMLQCAIRIGGRFKGFMGVDECKQNRVFTFDEIETLRNVAGAPRHLPVQQTGRGSGPADQPGAADGDGQPQQLHLRRPARQL